MNPVSELETITPHKALEMLVENTMNRPVSWTLVERIKNDILEDRWQVNGSTIRIAKDGTILDGQHRLNAIEQAGVAVKTFVVRGLEKECFTTIDTNCRSRKPSDILGIAGEKNVSTLSTALNWLCRYELDTFASKNHYSVADMQEQLEKHPEIRKSVEVVVKIRSKVLSASATACLHYLFARQDPELADVFLQGLVGGYNPDKYSNFVLLYKRLINNYTSKVKASPNEMVQLAVKAWNMTRKGKKAQVLGVNVNEVIGKIQ